MVNLGVARTIEPPVAVMTPLLPARVERIPKRIVVFFRVTQIFCANQ
jgi:hypothetical protein